MPGLSTWPTSGTVPTGSAVGSTAGGAGTETVRVERVTYGKGPMSERRPAFGAPEGNLLCSIKPQTSARNYEVMEHSMDEQVIRYFAAFSAYPDVRARDRLIWLDVGGSGLDKTLTVVAVTYDGASGTWTANTEEHTN